MNKKGSIYGFVIFLIFFLAVWAFWFGSFISDFGETAINDNNLTGLEALLYGNLNMIIFIALCISIYFGLKIIG